MHNDWAQGFWIALAASVVLAWPCYLLLLRLRSESVINPYAPETHRAKKGTPNMGGVFVVLAIAIALLLAKGSDANVVPHLVLLVSFSAIGFVDDYVMPRFTAKKGLGWVPKLVLEFAAAGLWLTLVGLSNESLMTAFLIVVFANAVNFADGLDALAAGLCVLAFLPMGVFFASVGNGPLTVLCFAVCGGLLPFLMLNAPPARVFMGDVGSLPLGAMFGLCLATAVPGQGVWPWALSLVFLIEFSLVPVQIVAVKTLGRRILPATPIHHAFENAGWPETRVVWLFLLVQAVLSAYALTVVLS